MIEEQCTLLDENWPVRRHAAPIDGVLCVEGPDSQPDRRVFLNA